MAGTKISAYSISDVNFTALMNTVDKQRIGYPGVSLTNYGNTTVPAIAAGSSIEIDGALYYFASDEAISVGSVGDGDVYIILEVAGVDVTASFTGTAPTWDDAKQGYYLVDSNENYRYLNFIMTKSGASYSNKRFIAQEPETKMDSVTFETIDISAFVTQDLSVNGYAKIGPLYIQWGILAANIASSTTITFPIEFPNACFSVTHNGGFNITSDVPTVLDEKATTGFRIRTADASVMNQDLYWMAIGY